MSTSSAHVVSFLSQAGDPFVARLAKPTLSPPRQWAWDLQILVLEAVEDPHAPLKVDVG